MRFGGRHQPLCSPRIAPSAGVVRPLQENEDLVFTFTPPHSQVVAIQRLHRAVRSALASPCSVVFSLPEPGQHTEASSADYGNNDSESYAPQSGGDVEAFSRGCDRDKPWRKRWGSGEGNMAALQVEV